jgi:succinyl-CoA synthetase alpha subunit
MAILLDENTNVLIQGITGREGTARARFMMDYGTRVVAGVTPGRGGTDVWHIPVYNSVEEACKEHKTIDASVTFVPGPTVKQAAFEAISSGIRTIVMPVERVPLHDILEILTYAKQKGTRIVGPGSIGLISPEKAVAGWIGGTEELARKVFKAGPVGVISRSGGQTTTVCWALTQEGLGESTSVHVGAEPIVGLSPAELLPLFEEDEQTEAIALFGEIGTVAEEEAAEVIKLGKFTKPVVAYISGVTAQPGVRFSHASAIIERGRGSAESKMKALKDAGVQVVERPEQIAPTVKSILRR